MTSLLSNRDDLIFFLVRVGNDESGGGGNNLDEDDPTQTHKSECTLRITFL